MLTKKARAQILDLERDMEYFRAKTRKYSRSGTDNAYLRRKYDTKYNAAYDRIDQIKESGLSTKEQGTVKRSLPSMFTIEVEKDIAGRHFKKTGNVTGLGYIVVTGWKGSALLRNVRGMASEARKVSISNVEFISKAKYDRIVQGIRMKGGARHEVSFMGAHQVRRVSR